jgi:hypothetical protein
MLTLTASFHPHTKDLKKTTIKTLDQFTENAPWFDLGLQVSFRVSRAVIRSVLQVAFEEQIRAVCRCLIDGRVLFWVS